MKAGLLVKCVGDGGMVEAVPRAREALAGEVGRRVRRCRVGCVGSGKW